MASYRFVDHSDVVLRMIGTNAPAALAEAAEDAVEGVQEKMLYGYSTPHGNPPHTEIVDTGALFDSIEADVVRSSQNAYSVDVGTSVPYAVYVHNGTYKLEGRPFITDGVESKRSDIEKTLSKRISKGFTAGT